MAETTQQSQDKSAETSFWNKKVVGDVDVADVALFAGTLFIPGGAIVKLGQGALWAGRALMGAKAASAALKTTEVATTVATATTTAAARQTATTAAQASAGEAFQWAAPKLSKETAEFAAQKAAERTAREAAEKAAAAAAAEKATAAGAEKLAAASATAAAGAAGKKVTQEAVEGVSKSLASKAGSLALDAGKAILMYPIRRVVGVAKFAAAATVAVGAGAVVNHGVRVATGTAGDTIAESAGRSGSQLASWTIGKMGAVFSVYADEMGDAAKGFIKDRLGIKAGEDTRDAIERALIEKSGMDADQAAAVADFASGRKKMSDFDKDPSRKRSLTSGLLAMAGMDRSMSQKIEGLSGQSGPDAATRDDRSLSERAREAAAGARDRAEDAADDMGELSVFGDMLGIDPKKMNAANMMKMAKDFLKDNKQGAMIGALAGLCAMGTEGGKMKKAMVFMMVAVGLSMIMPMLEPMFGPMKQAMGPALDSMKAKLGGMADNVRNHVEGVTPDRSTRTGQFNTESRHLIERDRDPSATTPAPAAAAAANDPVAQFRASADTATRPAPTPAPDQAPVVRTPAEIARARTNDRQFALEA